MPTEKKPLPEDFAEFIRLLNSAKVEYLILGGWAVNLYANPRATADIDFLVGIDERNVDKVLSVLAEFGLKKVPRDYFREKGNVIRMGIPPTRIEILTGATGIEFAECYKRKKIVKIGDLKMNFISKADLIKNKKAAGRLKDIADVDALE
jgi:hypothetical protein